MKIGIIGGTGWLGRLIAENVIRSSVVSSQELIVSNRSGSLAQCPSLQGCVQITTDNQRLIDFADLVVLAVLPQQFPGLAVNAQGKIIISVMAGVSTEKIQRTLGDAKIIRTMPNAAIEIQQSFTPWFTKAKLSVQEEQNVVGVLNCLGLTERVFSEREIDFFTALTGSGQGIIAYLQMALVEAAVAQGVSETLALKAVFQLFLGMSALSQKKGEHPQNDVKKLIDYAGTTAAILQCMQKEGIENLLAEALAQGYLKAKEGMTGDF